MKDKNIQRLSYCGILSATVFILTKIGFTFPGTNCYLHLGASMAVLTAFIMPPVPSAASIAVAMTISDLFSGYGAWAPFTFVIRFLQVYILSSFVGNPAGSKVKIVLGFIISGIVDVGGYFIAELIIYNTPATALYSAVMEVALNVFGAFSGVLAYRMLKKTGALKWFDYSL